MSIRLSVDIGGTFTDVVLANHNTLTTVKVLTTHVDPAAGVMQGVDEVLQRAGVQAADVSLVLHGTTLATNALIERRGAATALLTTQGHRDALEMAFENRFEQYDVDIDRPRPLVPRHWRIGVPERVAADGSVLLELDERLTMEQVGVLIEQGVDSLAVGFMHSYANPTHEQRVGDLIQKAYPQLTISLSSTVCPEIREFERLSTTVANAYVKPLMSRYLASLGSQLRRRGIAAQVLMMTSGGGLTTLTAAAEFPIRLVESGPAGGAMLAANMARHHQLDRVLSFDMGGTTAKVCLIDQGQPQHSRSFEVDRSYRFKKGSGLPVRIPVIEMVEIGAGGGSIARVDSLSRISVGPESAGSAPGPACYGHGGREATVTDADVVLGKLLPEYFAGGKLALEVFAANGVVHQHVGQPLGLGTQEAAHAIAEIVEDNMASAARAHAAEWGKEVGGRSLIAFGGAAPLHAAQLAGKLKIDHMLVPAGAGVGSAVGFLLAPIKFEVVRSHYARLSELGDAPIEVIFEQMHAEAYAVLAAAGAEDSLVETREAFMRYVGQGYEVAVDVSHVEQYDKATFDALFDAAYAAIYGRTIPSMDVEILSWTLSLEAPTPANTFVLEASSMSGALDLGTSDMFLAGKEIVVEAVPRIQLQQGELRQGPLLVVEEQTTTVVPPGASLEVLHDGTLSIRFGG